MDGIVAIGKAKKDIASALTGVASMVVGTDKQSIVVTTNDGATFRLNIPNPVDDPDLINRISINSEGNVCLDGEELAWKENIPVKVSELDNDENFVKLEELNEKLKQIVTSGTGSSIDGYTKGEVNTLLNKKLDKPETDGTVGQVLTVQADGTNAYQDVPQYDDTEIQEAIANKLDKPIVDGAPGQTLVLQDDNTLAYQDNVAETPIATVNTVGTVKPDGTTIIVNEDGVITAVGGGSSEKQIKDWVSGSSYLEGDYIYHEGELYRCLASNNDVDFDETNWKQLTYGIDELSKEDVERLLGLTKEEIEAMTDLILDTEVRIDKTYSSSKIYTDIQQCLEDSKTYTLKEIAKLSGASYKIVASVSEMTSESIIYLLASGNTYDMYIVEADGTATKIGDTTINLDDYFTKAEIEADYLKKVYATGTYATITTVNNHIGDTVAHMTQDEKDKLVTADDITNNINSGSTDNQVASAKATYDLANKKANKTHTHTTSDITDLSIPSKVSDLENDRGYLTSIPEEYITETELNAKGYLTSHQDISGLQTKTDNTLTTTEKTVTGAINELKSGLDDKVNKTDITTTINSTSTDTQIPTAKAVNVAIKGKLITQGAIDTYGKEIIKFPVGKWTIGSVAISNLTDLPNSYVRYIEIMGTSEVTNPWTNDNTIRSYKATSYKGDTFLRSLNSGSEAGVIASDTGWQRVLLNGDIIDNLTSTDTNKLLSANQGKILNDAKLNKTDANKLNCVTIDNVSLKEYILTNFTETGKTYYLVAKTTCTDLPKASNFYITVETPGLYTYKVTAKELNDSNGSYVCTYRSISSSWTAWEKVCTTTVADVPFTPITFKDSNIVSLGNSGYCVNNGWCHLVLEIQFNADMTFGWEGITSCNIPIPKTTQRTTKMILNSTTAPVKSIVCGVQGGLVLFGSASNTEQYFGSISYPVAE